MHEGSRICGDPRASNVCRVASTGSSDKIRGRVGRTLPSALATSPRKSSGHPPVKHPPDLEPNNLFIIRLASQPIMPANRANKSAGTLTVGPSMLSTRCSNRPNPRYTKVLRRCQGPHMHRVTELYISSCIHHLRRAPSLHKKGTCSALQWPFVTSNLPNASFSCPQQCHRLVPLLR